MKTWENDILSGYLDNQGLTDTEKQTVESAVQRDNSDIQIQKAVLRSVKSKTGTLRTLQTMPESLRLSVQSALQQEYSKVAFTSVSVPTPHISVIDKVIQTIQELVLKPVFVVPAFLLVIAGGYFILQQSPANSVAGNFHDESFQNFDAILAGTLKLQKATSNYEELDKFFSEQGVDYTILHPNISATLAGGVVSVMNGKKLAHVVYTYQGKYIYVYEAPEEMFTKHVLQIPERAVSYAESGKWLTESDDKHSWIFWREKTIYCSVVSDIPKEQLFSLFIKGV